MDNENIFNAVNAVEYYVGSARQWSFYHQQALGFDLMAYAGPETGVRDRVSYLLGQGDIRLIFTSYLNYDSPIADHVRYHGDGVKDISLRVENMGDTVDFVKRRGVARISPVSRIMGRDGTVDTARIYSYGETVHTLVEEGSYKSGIPPGRDIVIGALNTTFKEYGSKLINLRMYRSIRHDCDVIFWLSSHDPMDMSRFKESIMRAMRGYGSARYSMFSLYEHSPYLRDVRSLEDTLRFTPKKYFVAYPMSKTPDWYLIDYDERKKVLAEHIGMATSHPENQDIRSYTTYSYGLGDQEFVVLYETDSLSQWSHVTGKLREATARKWIIKEEPIFIGILSEPLKF